MKITKDKLCIIHALVGFFYTAIKLPGQNDIYYPFIIAVKDTWPVRHKDGIC